jgi:ABC-type sulfate transport system permease component
MDQEKNKQVGIIVLLVVVVLCVLIITVMSGLAMISLNEEPFAEGKQSEYREKLSSARNSVKWITAVVFILTFILSLTAMGYQNYTMTVAIGAAGFSLFAFGLYAISNIGKIMDQVELSDRICDTNYYQLLRNAMQTIFATGIATFVGLLAAWIFVIYRNVKSLKK